MVKVFSKINYHVKSGFRHGFKNVIFSKFFFGFVASLSMIISSHDKAGRIKDNLDARFNEQEDTFDFIVVGGGSAGSIVANRLSENHKVLLLEAGGEPHPLQRIPGMAFFILNHKETDWMHRTVPQRRACFASPHRRAGWSQGRNLGGSGNLNFMVHLRGSPRDYDYWSKITGDESWSYAGVLPYFRRHENYQGDSPDRDAHGFDGELKLEVPSYTGMAKEFIRAGQELGYEHVDLNARYEEGFDTIYCPLEGGERRSSFAAFLDPIRERETLVIRKYAHVNKILIRGFDNTAFGVEYDRHGLRRYAYATKEIIVSAGTVESAKLLMLSGVGPKTHLADLGIPAIANLPVGKNLQDHLATFLGPFFIDPPRSYLIDRDVTLKSFYEYKADGNGPLSSSLFQAAAMISSKQAKHAGIWNWPDIQLLLSGMAGHKTFARDMAHAFHMNHKTLKKYYEHALGRDSFFIAVAASRPMGRGEIVLEKKDPYAHPSINPRYLENDHDMHIMIEGIKTALYLVENTTSFQNLRARFTSKKFPGCEHMPFRSDDYFECYVRHFSVSMHDPVGTCAMGHPHMGKDGVLDSQLQVIGVNHLRVIDASVMPTIVGSGTESAVMMIAEKGADMIMEAWKTRDTGGSTPQPFIPSSHLTPGGNNGPPVPYGPPGNMGPPPLEDHPGHDPSYTEFDPSKGFPGGSGGGDEGRGLPASGGFQAYGPPAQNVMPPDPPQFIGDGPPSEEHYGPPQDSFDGPPPSTTESSFNSGPPSTEMNYSVPPPPQVVLPLNGPPQDNNYNGNNGGNNNNNNNNNGPPPGDSYSPPPRPQGGNQPLDDFNGPPPPLPTNNNEPQGNNFNGGPNQNNNGGPPPNFNNNNGPPNNFNNNNGPQNNFNNNNGPQNNFNNNNGPPNNFNNNNGPPNNYNNNNGPPNNFNNGPQNNNNNNFNINNNYGPPGNNNNNNGMMSNTESPLDSTLVPPPYMSNDGKGQIDPRFNLPQDNEVSTTETVSTVIVPYGSDPPEENAPRQTPYQSTNGMDPMAESSTNLPSTTSMRNFDTDPATSESSTISTSTLRSTDRSSSPASSTSFNPNVPLPLGYDSFKPTKFDDNSTGSTPSASRPEVTLLSHDTKMRPGVQISNPFPDMHYANLDSESENRAQEFKLKYPITSSLEYPNKIPDPIELGPVYFRNPEYTTRTPMLFGNATRDTPGPPDPPGYNASVTAAARIVALSNVPQYRAYNDKSRMPSEGTLKPHVVFKSAGVSNQVPTTATVPNIYYKMKDQSSMDFASNSESASVSVVSVITGDKVPTPSSPYWNNPSPMPRFLDNSKGLSGTINNENNNNNGQRSNPYWTDPTPTTESSVGGQNGPWTPMAQQLVTQNSIFQVPQNDLQGFQGQGFHNNFQVQSTQSSNDFRDFQNALTTNNDYQNPFDTSSSPFNNNNRQPKANSLAEGSFDPPSSTILPPSSSTTTLRAPIPTTTPRPLLTTTGSPKHIGRIVRIKSGSSYSTTPAPVAGAESLNSNLLDPTPSRPPPKIKVRIKNKNTPNEEDGVLADRDSEAKIQPYFSQGERNNAGRSRNSVQSPRVKSKGQKGAKLMPFHGLGNYPVTITPRPLLSVTIWPDDLAKHSGEAPVTRPRVHHLNRDKGPSGGESQRNEKYLNQQGFSRDAYQEGLRHKDFLGNPDNQGEVSEVKGSESKIPSFNANEPQPQSTIIISSLAGAMLEAFGANSGESYASDDNTNYNAGNLQIPEDGKNQQENSDNFQAGHSENYQSGHTDNYQAGHSDNYQAGNSNSFQAGTSTNYQLPDIENYQNSDSNNYQVPDSENAHTHNLPSRIPKIITRRPFTHKPTEYPSLSFNQNEVNNYSEKPNRLVTQLPEFYAQDSPNTFVRPPYHIDQNDPTTFTNNNFNQNRGQTQDSTQFPPWKPSLKLTTPIIPGEPLGITPRPTSSPFSNLIKNRYNSNNNGIDQRFPTSYKEVLPPQSVEMTTPSNDVNSSPLYYDESPLKFGEPTLANVYDQSTTTPRPRGPNRQRQRRPNNVNFDSSQRSVVSSTSPRPNFETNLHSPFKGNQNHFSFNENYQKGQGNFGNSGGQRGNNFGQNSFEDSSPTSSGGDFVSGNNQQSNNYNNADVQSTFGNQNFGNSNQNFGNQNQNFGNGDQFGSNNQQSYEPLASTGGNNNGQSLNQNQEQYPNFDNTFVTSPRPEVNFNNNQGTGQNFNENQNFNNNFDQNGNNFNQNNNQFQQGNSGITPSSNNNFNDPSTPPFNNNNFQSSNDFSQSGNVNGGLGSSLNSQSTPNQQNNFDGLNNNNRGFGDALTTQGSQGQGSGTFQSGSQSFDQGNFNQNQNDQIPDFLRQEKLPVGNTGIDTGIVSLTYDDTGSSSLLDQPVVKNPDDPKANDPVNNVDVSQISLTHDGTFGQNHGQFDSNDQGTPQAQIDLDQFDQSLHQGRGVNSHFDQGHQGHQGQQQHVNNQNFDGNQQSNFDGNSQANFNGNQQTNFDGNQQNYAPHPSTPHLNNEGHFDPTQQVIDPQVPTEFKTLPQVPQSQDIQSAQIHGHFDGLLTHTPGPSSTTLGTTQRPLVFGSRINGNRNRDPFSDFGENLPPIVNNPTTENYNFNGNQGQPSTTGGQQLDFGRDSNIPPVRFGSEVFGSNNFDPSNPGRGQLSEVTSPGPGSFSPSPTPPSGLRQYSIFSDPDSVEITEEFPNRFNHLKRRADILQQRRRKRRRNFFKSLTGDDTEREERPPPPPFRRRPRRPHSRRRHRFEIENYPFDDQPKSLAQRRSDIEDEAESSEGAFSDEEVAKSRDIIKSLTGMDDPVIQEIIQNSTKISPDILREPRAHQLTPRPTFINKRVSSGENEAEIPGTIGMKLAERQRHGRRLAGIKIKQKIMTQNQLLKQKEQSKLANQTSPIIQNHTIPEPKSDQNQVKPLPQNQPTSPTKPPIQASSGQKTQNQPEPQNHLQNQITSQQTSKNQLKPPQKALNAQPHPQQNTQAPQLLQQKTQTQPSSSNQTPQNQLQSLLKKSPKTSNLTSSKMTENPTSSLQTTLPISTTTQIPSIQKSSPLPS